MTDKDDIMIAELFKQAAHQQIEDNGFTERVMKRLEDEKLSNRAVNPKLLSRLWTCFCILVAGLLFCVLGGLNLLAGSILSIMGMTLTWLEVFFTTAPTTEIPVNPVVILLVVAFVLVFLPYQTYRKLSATL